MAAKLVPAEVRFRRTLRGFSHFTVPGRTSDSDLSIQKSSVATEDLIWIGHGEERAHLNREQALAASKILLAFARSGTLYAPKEVPVIDETEAAHAG